jgi:hypothetical protein
VQLEDVAFVVGESGSFIKTWRVDQSIACKRDGIRLKRGG